MANFIQISDLHIHTNNDEHENRTLKKLVSNIINKYSVEKPVVLITGDIVDDGKEEQYKNAVNLLTPLIDAGFTTLACPGNHDYGCRGNIYTEKSQQLFQKMILGELLKIPEAKEDNIELEDMYPLVREINGIRYIGIDSVVANEDQPFHFASGEVGKRQRGFLEKKINIPFDGKTVVYLHHHPFYHMVGLQMDDAQDFLKVIRGKAEILCFGHKHVPAVWMSQHEINWIFAASKTTEENENGCYQYREIDFVKGKPLPSMVTLDL